MKFGDVEATINFDEDISMFRGEFTGPKGGADFYAANLELLRKEGEISLKILLDFADEKDIHLGVNLRLAASNVQERLQKLIAQAGIASRRAAEAVILAGDVSVNGEIVTELGTKADPEKDHIKVRGKLINTKLQTSGTNLHSAQQTERLSLECRRPRRPQARHRSRQRPRQTASRRTARLQHRGPDHPHQRRRIYESCRVVKDDPKGLRGKGQRACRTANAINKLVAACVLEDGFKTAPAEIKDLKPTDKNGWYEVTLYEGHNQQIRKMFDAIGHSVVKLQRTAIGTDHRRRIATGKAGQMTAS